MSVLDRFRLDGKVAVVTGASSGLGVAFAKALAEAGASFSFGDGQIDEDVNSPFKVMSSKRVSVAAIAEPDVFDAKPGEFITHPGLCLQNSFSAVPLCR